MPKRKWTAEEARANAARGAAACTARGNRHVFTKVDRAKSTAGFTSETGRKASERKHDIHAMKDPEVTWIEDNAVPLPLSTPPITGVPTS